MGFEKGQKLRVKDFGNLHGNPLKKGDPVTVSREEGGLLYIEEASGGYFPWRFEAAFVPKFKKGQKLKVEKDREGLHFAAGEIVTAISDSRPSVYNAGSIDVEKSDGSIKKDLDASRFDYLAPSAPAFSPLFKKGQRLVVLDGTEESISKGDIVSASSDSYLSSAGHEVVRLEGHAFKTFYASRFKPAPAVVVRKGFKNGQKLVVLDAAHALNFLKEGETVQAQGDAWLGLDGREIVQVKSVKTGKAGTFHTTRFAAAPEEKPKFEGTVYYSEENGFSFDINEYSEGEYVAEYRLCGGGKLKVTSTID